MEKPKKLSGNGYNICYYVINRIDKTIFVDVSLSYYRHITKEQMKILIEIVEQIEDYEIIQKMLQK